MNLKSMRLLSVLILLLAAWPNWGQAQINVNDANPVLENFNSMASGTTLPSNWRISRVITTTNTSAVTASAIVPVASTANLSVGMLAVTTGGQIAAGTTIVSIGTGNVTLSTSNTISNGSTIAFTNGNNPDYNASINPTTLGNATTTGSATGNSYNYGQTTSDRAAGFQGSTSYPTPQAIMARYRNNTGLVMPDVTVSFEIERYRVNTNAASVDFFYSTDGATWNAVSSGNIAAANFPTGSSAFTFASPTTVSRTASITGVNLANGSDIYFRWSINTANANSQGLGLDNVSVSGNVTVCTTPSAQPTNLVFSAGTATSINGSFTAASGSPSGYLVVRYLAGVTPTDPTDGIQYAVNNSIGSGTVVATGSSTSFSTTGLVATNSYDIYVYAFNNAACVSGPKYNTTSPLTGLISPCAAPSMPAGINFTSIGTGSLTGTITGISGSPAGFLVAIYPTGSVPGTPVNNTVYTVGNTIGAAGIIVHTSALTTFTALNLSLNSTYDLYVYPYANANCLNGPVYASVPLLQTQATASCPSFSSTITINPTATPVDGSVYNTITAAVSQLSGCSINQPTILELASNYTSAGETFPINLPAVSGASATNILTIRPAVGASNLLITSATVGFPTLQINGGTNWIIDGRPGGTGTTYALTIQNTDNTTAGSMAIRLINGAQNNTITYCDVRTANIGVSSGCIAFATSSTVGNSNNIVSYNKVHEASTGLPNVGISSVGFAGFANDNNQILNNEIYNVFAATGNSYGIYISDNTTNWLISGNSIYQTASRVQTSGADRNYAPIASSPSTVSTVFGLNITGNYIGGTAPLCGGSPMTLSDNGSANIVLRGIFMQVGTSVPTSIQGNTIANISITSSSNSFNHSGISAVTGSMNIGTVTPNVIGSLTVNNSISLTQTTAATVGRLNGIIAGVGSPGTIVISNNQIGGLTVSNSSTGSVSLAGIHCTNTAYTISGNTIGGITNSLQNNTSNDVWGVNLTSASTGSTVSGNVIKNLKGTSGRAIGIRADGGANTLSGNVISNITSAASQADGVAGIVSSSSTAGQTISANTIHSVTNSSVASGVVATGIYYSSSASGTNLIERNLVHSVLMSSTATNSIAYGIRVLASPLTVSVQNNMIRLGLQSDGSNASGGNGIIGIFLGSTATHSAYFNTVYIGGSTSSATGNTYAFQSTATGNSRTYQNNIFVNERSGGTAGRHYAYAVGGTGVSPAGLTQNNNIYRATGSGGFTAQYNGSNLAGLTALQTAIGQDGNSYFCDPEFINATGNATTLDLHIKTVVSTIVEGRGITVGSVTTDFDGQTRSTLTPVDLGADAGNFIASDGCPLNWTGATNTDWHTSTNWDAGSEIPTVTSEAVIDGAASNQPVLAANAVTGKLTLTGNAQITVPTGLILSVNRDINAVSAASVIGEGRVSMDGSVEQIITGTFNVTNIRIANTTGVTVFNSSRLIVQPSTSTSAVLSFAPNAVLTNSGSVILRSDNVGTASLGVMPATAVLNGGLTVERKYPATPGWYFTGTPIVGATLLDWSELLPIVSPKQNANVLRYTEDDQTVTNINGRNVEENGWKVPNALTDLVNTSGQPRGHRLYIDNRFINSVNGTMSVTGTPFMQDVPVSLTKSASGFDGGGWNFIANPYPSAIDWNATKFDAANTGLNMSNAIHIWNGASANYGTWTALSAGSGIGVGIASSLVASSQAFFVKANAASTLTFKESFKSASGVSNMRTAVVANQLKFRLSQGTKWDEAAVLFYPSGHDLADQFDADNLPSGLDISTSNMLGKKLAINVMGDLVTAVQIPVYITGAVGNATIAFDGLTSFASGINMTLLDNFTGQRYDLNQNPVVSFNITSATASQGAGRFMLIITPTVTSLGNNRKAAHLSIYPNPAVSDVTISAQGMSTGQAVVSIIDKLGRTVSQHDMQVSEFGTGRLVIDNLPTGIYQVKVQQDTQTITQQLVIR